MYLTPACMYYTNINHSISYKNCIFTNWLKYSSNSFMWKMFLKLGLIRLTIFCGADVDGEIICSNWVYLVDDAIFYLFRDNGRKYFWKYNFFFLIFSSRFFRFDKQLLCIMWSGSFEFRWKRLIYHVQVICVLFRFCVLGDFYS